MKKKLLVTGLVFCCVWGAMASKLTDAAASGDFDTMKKQIELLDYDVKGDSRLLEICLKNWPIYEGKDEMYKKCIDYLMEKGAVIDYAHNYFAEYYSYQRVGYTFDKVVYMYDKKYDDVNRKWKNNKTAIDTFLEANWFSYDVKSYYIIPILTLLQYNPIVTAVDSIYYQLLTGDMSAIKSYLKSGYKVPVKELLLFVNKPEVIELLEATDSYDLNTSYDGMITPYFINEIVPKYCTHLVSQEEIEFMKFIANYNTSMDYEKSLAIVKDYIAKGVDLTKRIKLLGTKRGGRFSGSSDMLFVLPILLGNIEAFKLLMEASDFTLPIEVSNESMSNKYTVEPKFLFFSVEPGDYWAHTYVKKSDYNALKNVFDELSIKKAAIAAEKARIAREKAEAERIAREKKAEEDLIANYISKFCDNVRDILNTNGTVKKGEYKVKSKKFEYLGTRSGLYKAYRIYESGRNIVIENSLAKKPENIHEFSTSKGYTKESVQKVWNLAVDKVCDEFGIQ